MIGNIGNNYSQNAKPAFGTLRIGKNFLDANQNSVPALYDVLKDGHDNGELILTRGLEGLGKEKFLILTIPQSSSLLKANTEGVRKLEAAALEKSFGQALEGNFTVEYDYNGNSLEFANPKKIRTACNFQRGENSDSDIY